MDKLEQKYEQLAQEIPGYFKILAGLVRRIKPK
jgi:hypothetical protein